MLPHLSLSIYRLLDWVGEASDRAQDRGIRPEEERAGKWAGGTEEQDGLAGKGKEAENDEAHRAQSPLPLREHKLTKVPFRDP